MPRSLLEAAAAALARFTPTPGSLAAVAVALLAWAMDAPPANAQELHGVFVGINDYIEFEDEPGGDLLGAESDALVMRSVLAERWGLREENALTLLSREATKDAIEEAITGWLASRVAPGDLAIFYFAGHGAQAFDMDGDEPDGLDETLAPADVLMLSSANDIRDDEFRTWLTSVGTDIVVILDSCHSGTATRASTGMRTRSLDRPLPPEGGNEPKVVRQRPDPESMADGTSTILELAAAAPNQSALEGPFPIDVASPKHVSGADPSDATAASESRGAFTHFLVQELRNAPEDATYVEILRAVASRLERGDFMQSPQISGEGARSLFRPGRGR